MMITRWIGVLASILLFSSSTSMAADLVQPTDDSGGRSLPTWVLVHGGYGGAWIWYKIQVLLESEGYPVYAMDLTSHGTLGEDRTADSVNTLEDWASPLLTCLSNLTDKVILVTHGLGGAAASLAMEIYPDKIAKAVFIAGAMPKNGETAGQSALDEPVDPAVDPEKGKKKLQQMVDAGVVNLNYAEGTLSIPTSVEINITAARTVLYGRCFSGDSNLLRDLITPFPFRPFGQTITLTDGRYGAVPRYYIKCGLDTMVPIITQQKICDDNPPKMQFILKNADHAPMFSDAPYLYFELKSILKY